MKVQSLKHISLVCLVIQTTLLVLTMRFSRIENTNNERRYLPSTAVLLGEILKVVICILIIIQNQGFNLKAAFSQMKSEIFVNYKSTLKVFIPAALYTVQNNLLYLALSHLDAATYQVTYQLKILTTALFSVFLLQKRLFKLQWLSLIVLMLGVSLVQIPSNKTNFANSEQTMSNQMVGLVAVILACLSSGFSGVYFEKILKESSVTLWIRNIQLGLLGTVTALFGVMVTDGQSVKEFGFFQGYNRLTWIVIGLQAVGGLVIAVVMKYADNILKGFATSMSIVVSSIVSYYIFSDFIPTIFFLIGTVFVVMAIFLYSYVPKPIDETLPK